MKPLSRLDISSLTAKKLNHEQDVVDDVARAFYRFVHEELSSLEHTHVNVIGLGTFWVRKKKVLNAIERQEKTIEMLDHRAKLSLSKYSTLHEAKEKLEKLKILLVKIEEEENRKSEIKGKRR
jgi:nucleoid DNA-binding protein